MEKLKLINQSIAGRWLIWLLTLLFVPIGARGDSYGLTVGGVAVTDQNASNVLGDDRDEHYIVFDASTNTLTLNNYDEESDYEIVGSYEGAFIKNGLTNLTINLVGFNRIYCSLFLAKNVSGGDDYTATFTTETSSPGSMILRVDDESIFYSGHTIVWNNGLARINNGYDNDKNSYEIELTTDYRLSVDGSIICTTNGDVVEGVFDNKVTFDATNNTLTLNNAAISGSIVKTANEAGEQLIVNLIGANTVNGQILFQSENRWYPGDLTFTGSGSLNIASNDGVFDGVSSVNTAGGLYIATDSPDPQCNNGYYINGTTDDDNWVRSLTVSTSVTYPIWVYNTSTTHYTQLTAAASSFTTPEQNADGNHSGSVSFSDNTLTLTDFLCKTTENNDFVFFVGKSLKNLTVNLVGESNIHYNGFHYAQLQETEEEPTLTFTTSDNGKLTFEGEPSFWYVTVNYENGLGFYSNVISTDWPRLKIGGTFVRGTASTIGDYSNVSFDDATNTLTLGGVTIGTQTSTVTDIDVFIKDLKVEISGTNTVYGRFYGLYEENGYRAGTITFKKKSGAETAELTVSGLGDGNGPVTNFASSILGEGLYISGIDDDNEPISTLSYQGGEYYSLAGNMAKTVTISENAPDTKLWIGETEVTSANAEDVFGDGKVSYNMTTQTLSLNGATIEEEIVSNVGTLTINLTGSNNINMISATGNATALAFTGDGTLTLENSDGIIYGFSSVDFGDFNLQSSVPGIHWSETHHTLCNYDDDMADKVTLTKDVVYQLWINGVQVTEANKNGITGEEFQSGEYTLNTIEGTVKFTPGTDNVLLLKKAQLSVGGDDAGPAIVSGLDNLTIQLDGDGNDIEPARSDVNFSGAYGNYIVKSINSNAVLTFTALREDACLYSTISSSQYAYAPFNGFSNIVYNGSLVLIATNTDWQCLKNLSKPSISPDGSTYYLSQEDYQLDGVKIYYTIDYVNGEDVTTPTLYKDNEGLTISGPCTLTAYAQYVQNGVTKKSSNLKAKYFGSAESPFKLVYGGEAKALTLSPAIEEGDGIKISSVTEGTNATFDATTQKFTPVSTGTSNRTVTLTYTAEGGEYEEGNTVILNESFNLQVDVVPSAPIITPNGGSLAYDQTITLSLPEGCDANIMYKWGDGTEQAYTAPIEVQTGTLTAWAIRTEDPANLLSDEVTATFTTLLNPELSFSVIENVVRMGTPEDAPTLKYSASMTAAPTVTWSSDHPEIATVDETTGVVTPVAVSATKATITATFAGDDTYAPATASYKVEVAQGNNYLFIQYKGESTTLAKVKVTKGKTLDIKENYNLICPAELVSSLTWTPDASTIATVNDGVVSGVGCGNTRIVVAFAGNDNYEADTYEFYVDVAPLAPTIAPEAGAYLSTHDPITITKENIANTAISYTWDDITGDNDATWIDYADAGVALQTGTLYARVGYTPDDYGDVIYSDTVSVVYTVILDPELKYMQGTTEVTTAEWTLGKSDNTALPVLQNTHNVAVTYESDNTAVATVANDGTVTVVGIGTATITATSAETAESAANEVSYTLTVNRQLNVSFSASNHWTTYYVTENLTTPEGLQAYIVTGVEGTTVNVSTIGYIPANTAVLLKVDEGEMVAFSTVASAYTGATSTFETNRLLGTTAETAVSGISGTIYVLYNDEFVKTTSGSVPANRGYLTISDAVMPTGSRLAIKIGDETVQITAPTIADSDAEQWYDLQGRRIQRPQSAGIYIKNDKKIIIK